MSTFCTCSNNTGERPLPAFCPTCECPIKHGLPPDATMTVVRLLRDALEFGLTRLAGRLVVWCYTNDRLDIIKEAICSQEPVTVPVPPSSPPGDCAPPPSAQSAGGHSASSSPGALRRSS